MPGQMNETGTVATSSIQSQANANKAAASSNDNQEAPKSSSLGHNTTSVRNSKKGIEVQDELGRIVLVGKGLMEDWRKMQETLRTDMEK